MTEGGVGSNRLLGRLYRKEDVSGSAQGRSLSVSFFPASDDAFLTSASVYISGRPFVLRDSSAAKTTMTLSDRAEVLEGIERRLKDDILQESRRYVP